jgi:hypothetical protein
VVPAVAANADPELPANIAPVSAMPTPLTKSRRVIGRCIPSLRSLLLIVAPGTPVLFWLRHIEYRYDGIETPGRL